MSSIRSVVPKAALAAVAILSATTAWVLMSRFGVLALVVFLGGLIGVSVLTYISNKDLSFTLMIWMLAMGGTRTIGMISMPGMPDFSFDRILLIWIIMLFGIRVMIERMKMPGPYNADYFLLTYTIYVFVQLHVMDSIHVHAWVISSFTPFFAYLYGRYIIRSSNEIRNIILFVAGLGIYYGITSIGEKFGINAIVWPKQILNPDVGPLWQVNRARGPVMHPPLNGQLMGMMLLTFIYFIARSRTVLLKLISIAGFLITGLGVFFAFTRGPWVAAVAGMGVMGLLRPSFRRVLVGFGLCLMIVGMLGLYQTMNSDFLQERIQNENTIENRIIFLSASVRIFRDHPVFGVGFFRYNDYRHIYHQGIDVPFYGYVSKHMGENVVIHDIYLGRLAEEGLIGVLLLLGFSINIFKAFKYKWRHQLEDKWFDRDVMALFAAFMVCYHIGGMVIDYRYFDLINVLFFLIAGIVYGYRNEEYGFGQPVRSSAPQLAD